MINAQQIYDASPYWVKTVLLNIYSANLYRERYGREFQEISSQLNQSQWFNTRQIHDYQSEKLCQLVDHCYNTVPYYKSLFNSIKLKPKDIKDISDLNKIPLLTKKDINENFQQLHSTENSSRTQNIKYGGTSGTTGTPLKIGWDRHMRIFNNAIDWRQKKWAGIEPGDPIALLLGRTIIAIDKTSPPYWQRDCSQNFLWMSAFHLSERNLPHYIEKLNHFSPAAIEGYPSTLYEIAKYMVSRNIEITMKAVFSSSEPLYPVYRETIEQAFNCKVYDFYGLAERTIFATQCESHHGHHLSFEYGATEFVDEGNIPNRTSGFLVTSGLHNYAMPLLRYRVTDMTSLIHEECPCGRKMPRIHSIETKKEDMVYKVDGTPISPSILTHPFKPITSIKKSQIIQTGSDKIVIKIVSSSEYTSTDQDALLTAFNKRVGENMNVDIEIVDDIDRDRSGKYRWVINKTG